MLEPEPSNEQFSERTDENDERAPLKAFSCSYKSTWRSIYSRKPSELWKDNESPVSAPGTFPPFLSFLPSSSSGRRYHSSKLFRPRLLEPSPLLLWLRRTLPRTGRVTPFASSPSHVLFRLSPVLVWFKITSPFCVGPTRALLGYTTVQNDRTRMSLLFLCKVQTGLIFLSYAEYSEHLICSVSTIQGVTPPTPVTGSTEVAWRLADCTGREAVPDRQPTVLPKKSDFIWNRRGGIQVYAHSRNHRKPRPRANGGGGSWVDSLALRAKL